MNPIALPSFRRPWPVVFWLLTVTVTALGCGQATDPEAPPKRLFLITVDTLRADHLGFQGYSRATSPNLDRLAADSVVFENAIAQWPKTGPSFASIFTGQYPQTTGLTHHAALRLPPSYLTLPELFQHSGFRTLAVVSNGVLAKRLGWDQGFDEYLQTWDLAPSQSDDPEEYRQWINARQVDSLARPLLEKHRDAEKLFVWLHYSDPHAPYLLPGDFANPFLGDASYSGSETVVLENPRATALGERRDLKHYVASYDANILFTDSFIGKILERLESLDLLRDSLVVFTADHGESLGEHGYYFGHGRLPHNPGSHVPLFFHFADSDRRSAVGDRRVSAKVELVDLYPTLRDLLVPGKEVPGLEGKSLAPFFAEPPQPERETTLGLAFSQAGGGSPLTHFRSVQDSRFKLVYHPPLPTKNRTRPERWELYDLMKDPGETNDLLGGLSQLPEAGNASPGAADLSPEGARALRSLRRQLIDWMDGRTWIRPPRAEIEAHNEETLKTLRALGYIQ